MQKVRACIPRLTDSSGRSMSEGRLCAQGEKQDGVTPTLETLTWKGNEQAQQPWQGGDPQGDNRTAEHREGTPRRTESDQWGLARWERGRKELQAGCRRLWNTTDTWGVVSNPTQFDWGTCRGSCTWRLGRRSQGAEGEGLQKKLNFISKVGAALENFKLVSDMVRCAIWRLRSSSPERERVGEMGLGFRAQRLLRGPGCAGLSCELRTSQLGQRGRFRPSSEDIPDRRGSSMAEPGGGARAARDPQLQVWGPGTWWHPSETAAQRKR